MVLKSVAPVNVMKTALNFAEQEEPLVIGMDISFLES